MQAAMETRARAVEAANPGLTFRVMGYTDEMHKWMQISDLFIGKPGGLTTAECLACGLPMIIVAPIPGQEERNSDHLLEKGIALKCNEFTTLAYKIDGLLDHPDQLKTMREKARWYGRPHAAATIVEALLNEPVRQSRPGRARRGLGVGPTPPKIPSRTHSRDSAAAPPARPSVGCGPC